MTWALLLALVALIGFLVFWIYHPQAHIVNNNGNRNWSFCGGSIVNNNWVGDPTEMAHQPDELDKISAALKRRHVPQAAYDSQQNPGCMKGTREEILDQIKHWARKPDGPKIFWISGMVGTGKTSIATTVCKRASTDTEIMLGGTFFCSRSTGNPRRREIRCVIPTLAQLLAQKSVSFRSALANKIDADVVDSNVAIQVEQLLRVPLLALEDIRVPILFVIDDLDICGAESATHDAAKANLKAVTDMLRDLLRLTESKLRFTIKLLVTARPEPQIRDALKSYREVTQIMQLHAVNQEVVKEDIRVYITRTLCSELSDNVQLPDGITNSDVEKLVQLSDGLFGFAATVLDHTLYSPSGTDAAIMNFHELLGAPRDWFYASNSVSLKATYDLILDKAAIGTLALVSDVTKLGDLMRLLASVLFPQQSIATLGTRLGLRPDEVRGRLALLHAVINVPDDNNQCGLRTVHASFDDYLFGRAPNDNIRQSLSRNVPAQACLDIMGNNLRLNISPTTFPSTEFNPSPLEPDVITVSLEYACMHWAHHVANTCEPCDYPAFNISTFVAEIDQTSPQNFKSWPDVARDLGKAGLAPGVVLITTAAVRSLPREAQHWTLKVLSKERNSMTRSTLPDNVNHLPLIYGVVARVHLRGGLQLAWTP